MGKLSKDGGKETGEQIRGGRAGSGGGGGGGGDNGEEQSRTAAGRGGVERGERTPARAATEREAGAKETSIAGTGGASTETGGEGATEPEGGAEEESEAFLPAGEEEGEEPGLRF